MAKKKRIKKDEQTDNSATTADVESYIKDDAAAKRVIDTALKEGCLLKIRTTGWGNRAALTDEEVEGLNVEFARGTKDLIDRSAIKETKQIRRQAIRWARKHCLPWIDDGVYFIPRSLIEKAVEYLDEAIERQRQAVDDLCANFLEHKEQMRREVEDANKKNGTNIKFDDWRYPSVEALRNKFSIGYQFYMIAVPEGNSILSGSQIQSEKRKLEQSIKEAAEVGILWVRKKFAEIVIHLQEVLATGGKFKNASVTNLQDFINTFDDINVWNDAELKKLVANARKAIGNVDPQDLRDDDKYAKSIEDNMGKVVKGIKDLGDKRLKRAVKF